MGRAALDLGARAVRWVNNLTHTKGTWAGQAFSLRPWQALILQTLFGTLKADGTRQYRTCYVEIPRKNGKTELAAAIALYMLMGDGEQGAEVYGAAVDSEQASLAFNVAGQMVRSDPELTESVQIIASRRRMVHVASGSVYRAIAADAASAHGYNASAIVYDELHAAPNRELWDVLTTSTGARRQPLTFVITTAGFDRTSICWELHEYAEKVRDGIIPDPSFLPVLYSAPVEAEWTDERVWAACNPALGDFRSLDEMRVAARQARQVPARQNSFRRLYLCQWTEQATRWLDMASWRACGAAIPDVDLVGLPCWGGLDLGQSDDFSAFVRLWELPDGRVATRCRFWIPETALTKYRLRPYGVWRAGGHLTVTDGNTCDYELVEREVAELCRESGVRQLAYDKRFAERIAIRLNGIFGGDFCVDTPQGFGLNESLRNLSDLVVNGKLCHGNDPVLTWMASNAVVRRGAQKGDIRLDKEKAGDKIDGIAALGMANSRRVLTPETTSVYETRGVLLL